LLDQRKIVRVSGCGNCELAELRRIDGGDCGTVDRRQSNLVAHRERTLGRAASMSVGAGSSAEAAQLPPEIANQAVLVMQTPASVTGRAIAFPPFWNVVRGELGAAASGRLARAAVDRFVRRAFELAFAVAVLVLTAPIVLSAVVAIRLESPGPAFFRQRRLGLNGKAFTLLKLRGMYTDARTRFPALYDYSAEAVADSGDFFYHREADPRVTRVGRFLRKYSIDELPNFWNVLRGEMSIVGPRPEIPELAHLYGDHLVRFLSVCPGVTSPAKAGGRDHLSFAETLAIELDYIDRRSFALDIKIIVRTVAAVIRARNVV
jgi:lipopolysaccharide/colanic/teichoic acid biosynthesis glycosyltransferase